MGAGEALQARKASILRSFRKISGCKKSSTKERANRHTCHPVQTSADVLFRGPTSCTLMTDRREWKDRIGIGYKCDSAEIQESR